MFSCRKRSRTLSVSGSVDAAQGVRGLRTCGVLVPTVKKMTTLETTARASCDQKLIQLMRLANHITPSSSAHRTSGQG